MLRSEQRLRGGIDGEQLLAFYLLGQRRQAVQFAGGEQFAADLHPVGARAGNDGQQRALAALLFDGIGAVGAGDHDDFCFHFDS